ncbi:hypothetical protein [uncultured phage cr52_1]|uniref:Uncharacterized protein n=1 Tax=uncultured phage cr52_1 TaxID=2772079 RepID=A0A7M1RSI2_9CAUD|nr:hypothetical protein KNV46_gp09 [uncultured phage cr52_1]QOR56629.1 hypothetical protein [uncultured phage cr52_1]
MITKVDKQLRYSVKINYRDVLASICINELTSLLDKVDFVQDRLMLKAMICHCLRQIGTDIPLGLATVCNLFTPYTEPECYTGRVIYNIYQQGGGIEEAPIDGKQYARQNAQWSEVKGGGSGDMETNIPLVKPTLMATWINTRTGNSSNSLSINAEIGDKYKWSGTYMWSSKLNYKDPEDMESNVFNELTKDGEISSLVDMETLSNTNYYITLKAPKTGYEIIDGTLVPATGDDRETATSSISFLYPAYYGVEGSLKKQLVSSLNITISNVTTGSNEYFVYKYPSNFPKLTTITLNDAYNVTQAFNYSEELFVTDTGLKLTMRVYTSDNPGAFTSAKLNFK